MDELPKRKQIRLNGFDYSQNNYYFVTICTRDKKHIFGMGDKLTAYGKIADKCIKSIPDIFGDVRIDKYVIMPNHIHAIVVIETPVNIKAASMYACPTLGTIISNYKAAVTREIHHFAPDLKVWQSRYYDHVIRDKSDYENIWTYIDDNPFKWESDEYNYSVGCGSPVETSATDRSTDRADR